MRNPLTFSPFLGGKRVCLGKTFAEVMIRFTIPILFHHFDFKLINPDHLTNKPKVNIGVSKTPVLPVLLTIKNLA
jgi:cytochrome P450